MTLAIIVHGGAHAVPDEDIDAHKAGCTAAVTAGWQVLQRGGSALDAVEAAIRVLEADPTFNAGYGSELNADGEVETDAAIMNGADLAAGGIGAIKGVRHPISVARKVLQSPSVLLVGQGAYRFAQEAGAELCDQQELASEKQRRKWEEKQQASTRSANVSASSDTVGCVALDAQGNLAAGTSTGGTNENAAGRIGDSPLIGCGLYADGELGACSLTGDGESITRVVLAKTAVDLLHGERHPEEATAMAMDVLQRRVGGEGGCIMIDRQGRIGWAHNAENMSCAIMSEQMDEPQAFVKKLHSS
ncbi:MAG TPA: isoaspartyl peptidase/L-asparaginase family protein [Abditibacteriaceae bacterium]|jgi:beta-aspartyl-peptidase (threonine type)